MKQKLITLFILHFTLFVSHAMAQSVPAFPGAEGHGRYATGGRGGVVRHVTNLNDSGEGSFRAAVNGNDKKIVVFDVGGVIALRSNVNIGSNTTIAGQTAPAPGITLRYYTVNPAGNNIVMRFIRIRRGQEKDVNDGADASTARHYTSLMLDHCSFSWSIDEVASFYDNNNFTMQWCTVGESLNNAGHNKGAHGYGGIWGGKLASFHHNMICHVNNRSPRFNGARYDWTGYTSNTRYREFNWQNAVQAENVDFRNCVVYNCGNGCYGGPGGGQVNMVNNYYKTGPAGATTQLTTVTVGASGNSEGYPKYWTMTSRYYLSGNQLNNTKNAGWSYMNYDNGTYLINGKRCSPDPNHYNGDAVTYYKNSNGTDCVAIALDEPAPTGDVTTHSAATAFDKVLSYAGASLVRDNVDERYMTEARNGTATYTGSVTGKPGRIDKVSDVEGYTEANFGSGSREAGFDTDKDGMPDAWETANGLNPNSAADAKNTSLDPAGWYTNLEVYLNSLVQDIMLAGNADADDTVKEYFPAYRTTDGQTVEAVNPDVAIVQHDDDQKQSQGAITWELTSGGTEESVNSGELASRISSTAMDLGSALIYKGTRKLDNLVFTQFEPTAKAGGAAASNAVTFSLTPAEGCKFAPTRISFLVSRIGTDGSAIDVEWTNADGITTIETGLIPDRNSATPSYTTYSRDITSIVPAEGPQRLSLYIYNLSPGKQVAIRNVSIEGYTETSQTTGISPQITSPGPQFSAAYNLNGQRIGNGYKGIVIVEGKKVKR